MFPIIFFRLHFWILKSMIRWTGVFKGRYVEWWAFSSIGVPFVDACNRTSMGLFSVWGWQFYAFSFCYSTFILRGFPQLCLLYAYKGAKNVVSAGWCLQCRVGNLFAVIQSMVYVWRFYMAACKNCAPNRLLSVGWVFNHS